MIRVFLSLLAASLFMAWFLFVCWVGGLDLTYRHDNLGFTLMLGSILSAIVFGVTYGFINRPK